MTLKQVANHRNKKAKQFVPEKHRSKVRTHEGTVPYAYLTIEAKWVDKQTGRLCCTKPHAHNREICSNAFEPQRTFLFRAARALRIAKQHSRDHMWTLWNQTQVAPVIQSKLSTLKEHPERIRVYPCGASKEPISFAKCDTSQFFKDAAVDRGKSRAGRLLDWIFAKTPKSAVRITRGAKAGRKPAFDSKEPPKGQVKISFSDIRAALSLASEHRFLVLGSTVVERVKGWPMGGSMSEPATLADLGDDIHTLYENPKKAKHCGFCFPGLSAPGILQGILYVDDYLCMSKILCSQCIFTGIKKLIPRDVGMSLEADSFPMDYLQARFRWGNGQVIVEPFNANENIAKGEEDEPHVARVTHFKISRPALQFEDIRNLIVGKILVYNAIAEGEPFRARQAVPLFTCECLRQTIPCTILVAVYMS